MSKKKIYTLDEIMQQDSVATLNPKTAKKGPKASKTPKELKDEKLKPAANKLVADANFTINAYTNKIPDIKVLRDQIKIVTKELDIYKANGSKENVNKCLELLSNLKSREKVFSRIFTNREYSTKDATERQKLQDKVAESEEIQNLKKEQKEIRAKIRENTVGNLTEKYRKLKKQIEISGNLNYSDVVNFDDFVEDGIVQNDAEIAFEEFCKEVSERFDIDYHQLLVSNFSNFKNLIQEKIDTELVKELNIEFKIVSEKISNEIRKLSGKVSAEDVLFKIIDFKTDESHGKIPKEILAAKHVKTVNSIAYNVCLKYNQLHNLDEAVSGGLMGLAVAINAWYDRQVMIDSPLQFDKFIQVYVAGAAQRSILNIQNVTISGSSLADMMTRKKQKLEDFIKYNPTMQDLPKELVQELLNHSDDENILMDTVSETTLSQTIGGDEGVEDVWSLIPSETGDSYINEAESKDVYSKILIAIRDIMNMFEVNEDREGNLFETNKPIFDKYDKKLFLMQYGLDFDLNKQSEGKSIRVTASQEDMQKAITLMMMADGRNMEKLISQSAISTRLKNIADKLQKLMEFKPDLKAGIEYLINYASDNQSAMHMLSNYREEIAMGMAKDELMEVYEDDVDAMNTQLINNRKLGDIFEITEENPLDDEIAGMFNDMV